MAPSVRGVLDPLAQALDPEFGLDPGPVVGPDRLLPAALRARFSRPPAWEPEQRSDGARFRPQEATRPAAVLIALVPAQDGLRVLFTRRSADLPDHPGQISLPGGRVDDSDASAEAAALREAHEETGLDPATVEVLGCLPVYHTVTGYEVTPVVGLLAQAPRLAAAPHEVAEIFDVALHELTDGARWQRRLVGSDGPRRTFFAIDAPGRGPAGEGRYFIWGATAAILRNFYRFLLAGDGATVQSQPRSRPGQGE
jgi:8-oxo-dGTP pyrophosphatase MutT (NUDIX family)